jgi:uncharacterized cupin superfamily protein
MSQDPPNPIEPVIAVADVTMEPRPEAMRPTGAAAEKFHVERSFLTKRLGLKTLGVNVTRVAPGKTGYPFHSHRVNDELFYVIAGRGELRLGEARHPVKAGDLVGCPAGGPETAHQLINTGAEPLHYLSMSSELDPEVCEYPDSKKVGVWAGDYGYMTRGNQPVAYWDGE